MLIEITGNLYTRHLKSTCDVENDKHRPMGGIEGCILLLNKLLVSVITSLQIPVISHTMHEYERLECSLQRSLALQP